MIGTAIIALLTFLSIKYWIPDYIAHKRKTVVNALFHCKTNETFAYYFLYDGQGNVARVTNIPGEIPYDAFYYDSYGVTLEDESPVDRDYSSYKGYDQGPLDEGLYKTGVRMYDPETGVFLSPDPFKGYLAEPASQHPYMYCHGNPIRYSDPSGYDPGRDYFMGKTSNFGSTKLPEPNPFEMALIKLAESGGWAILAGADGPCPLADIVFGVKAGQAVAAVQNCKAAIQMKLACQAMSGLKAHEALQEAIKGTRNGGQGSCSPDSNPNNIEVTRGMQSRAETIPKFRRNTQCRLSKKYGGRPSDWQKYKTTDDEGIAVHYYQRRGCNTIYEAKYKY